MVAQPLAALGTPHALWGSRRRPRPLLTVALVCSEPKEGAAWFLPPQWGDRWAAAPPSWGPVAPRLARRPLAEGPGRALSPLL